MLSKEPFVILRCAKQVLHMDVLTSIHAAKLRNILLAYLKQSTKHHDREPGIPLDDILCRKHEEFLYKMVPIGSAQ